MRLIELHEPVTEQVTPAKKNGSREFRVHTASTKVTQSELAAARGIRVSEWIREVLLRELHRSDRVNSGDQANYGRRTLTEIVGLQLFLTNVLSPLSRGEWMTKEQYEQLMRQVKVHKHRATEQILTEQPPHGHA